MTPEVLHSVDLARIDAVGFDLDHTLAIYDDDAVNAIATAAARRLLVEQLGYPRALVDSPGVLESPRAGRSLAADLRHGAVVKMDMHRRVRRARLRGEWLPEADLARTFAGDVPDATGAAYTVYSPFELPVLWLLEELEVLLDGAGDRARRCRDVRHMLDVAHTDGTLKTQLRSDLARFVTGVPGTAGLLAQWRAAGKKLFVVTNSETDFASAVLERVVGPAWRDLFAVVVTSAGKPAFFDPAGPRRDGRPMSPGPGSVVIEGGNASALESLLRVETDRVIFVGDNARSDIRAARAHGWRTAYVVAELGASPLGSAADAWGEPLIHDGVPTWLARTMRDHADVACNRVDAFLGVAPDARLEPDGGEPGRSNP